MTTTTQTLAEFLLQRLAEDEAAVKHRTYVWATDWGHIASPARVLADIEAKRRIVDLTLHGCGDDYERVQRALASVYADHPDWRPEWAL